MRITDTRPHKNTTAMPPHDREAEVYLLGSLFHPGADVNEVLDIIRGPQDFWFSENASVFAAICDVHDRGEPIDIVTVKSVLADRGLLEGVGGIEYLAQVLECMPHGVGAVAYAKVVRDKARLRSVLQMAEQIQDLALQPTHDIDHVIDRIEVLLLAAICEESRRELITLTEPMTELVERLASGSAPTADGIKTRFYDIDDIIGALRPGNLVVLAARPSHGKTALALSIALQIVSSENVSVGFFSLEQSLEELASRALANLSAVSGQLILHPKTMLDEHIRRLEDAVEQLKQKPAIIVDDTTSLSLMRLRARARRMVAKHDVKIIFVDYLQIMELPDPRDTVSSLGILSSGLKSLARELKLPIVCLSQLNRLVEGRHDHLPKLSDLRGSGSIEQDADTVMLLHREDVTRRGEDSYQPDSILKLVIAKHRNGPTGVCQLLADDATLSFKNLQRGALK